MRQPNALPAECALRCLADAAKGLESAGATERALGRWGTKQKTAKATHVKIEICLACALFNSEHFVVELRRSPEFGQKR